MPCSNDAPRVTCLHCYESMPVYGMFGVCAHCGTVHFSGSFGDFPRGTLWPTTTIDRAVVVNREYFLGGEMPSCLAPATRRWIRRVREEWARTLNRIDPDED